MPEIKDNADENLPAGTPVKATSDSAAENGSATKKGSAAKKSSTAEEAVQPAVKPVKSSGSVRARRRWPAVLVGAATLALAVVAVGAASVYPGIDATSAVTPVPHPLPVGEALANCQGPTQLLAGSSAGADPEFSANSSGTTARLDAVVLSGASGELPMSGVQALDGKFSSLFAVSTKGMPEPKPTELPGAAKARAGVVSGKTVGAPSVLGIQPLGQEISQGSGSVVVAASDGDLAGLAAATCQRPSNELWISGASTSIARTALLAISNSSPSPATVSLELFGANGPIAAPGGKGLVVAPGTVRSVVLAGLAPDQEQLSVHLKSSGGAVSAVIQQSVLRGLTPGGVDYLAPVQAPGSSFTIPGVRVQTPSAAAEISAQDGYKDAATNLVVTVPGAGDAVIEVKAYGAEGQVALPNGGVFTAGAGKVTEFSLAGLPKDIYSISVNADASVTAAVRLVNFTKPGKAVDLALAPSAARLGDTHLVTVPQGVGSTLAFVTPEGEATLKLVPISESGVLGTGKDLQLKAGKTATVNPVSLLGPGTAAVLVSVAGAPTFGTQLLDTADSANIAVLPIAGTTSGALSIDITTGY